MCNVERQVFAFEVWVGKHPDFRRIINARTAGKAKAEYYDDLIESWPDFEYTDLRVRKVGSPVSSEQFIRTATYRGMPEIRCGDRVSVGDASGVVVGNNASANFNVLFDDDSPKWPGLTLNVHPMEITRSAT